jgi:hypothetical protein
MKNSGTNHFRKKPHGQNLKLSIWQCPKSEVAPVLTDTHGEYGSLVTPKNEPSKSSS